ncbi:hypothetical protein SELMODRAFT_423976 [Selaginella moellendorffii]|uniref:Uncharacterized protein n=1 Tax=Selaginella moellendorffii TaxID=88036 RepID=D8SNE3_SELML|nr:hypothetical protein SELMODRAFT_423976 [Selaginella moellendorffii]
MVSVFRKSHVRGNKEHNNNVDVEMDTQIDIVVIEAVGISALEATATSGGVLAFDVGGGGGAVPLVVEAAHGEVDESAEEVIGSVVGGSTEGMVHLSYNLNMVIYSSFAKVRFGSTVGTFIVSPTFPRTGQTELVTTELEQKWILYGYKSLPISCFCMLNQFAFQAYTLVHDIEHFQFIGMLSLEEVQTLYNHELPLDFLVAVWAKELVKH